MSQLRIVDLFAGWGGFTEGIQQAGHSVVWAANHWVMAVEAHEANHPDVTHVCQDLHHANWRLLPEYDVLVAAPACQGHSMASQPKRRAYHDHLRATAWVVTEAAAITRPKAIIVENVPSFMRWGTEDRPGILYQRWKQIFEDLGYDVNEYIVDATLHGVPQRRKRLFVIATMRPGFEYKPLQPPKREPSVRQIIDWKAGRWRPISEAKPGRRKVIRAGLKAHGPRFVGQDVTGHRGIPLSEAIRTITCQDQWFVVDDKWYRPLTIRESARAMGFPDWYTWPERATRTECIEGLGNAVCPPVAKELITQVAKFLGAKGRPRRAARRRLKTGSENPLDALKAQLLAY
jgi:DNA (cytosine-5)-methyltransferase 1